MSVSTIENNLRSLHSELERLSRSLEQEEKKELRYLSSKTGTKKSITKNTSTSTLKSKMRTISSYLDKVNASQKKQSEIKVKIRKKQTEITQKQDELQKEQNKAFSEMENVSKDVVEQHSPILAEMMALRTADFTVKK